MNQPGNLMGAYKGAAVVIAMGVSVFAAPMLWAQAAPEAWSMLLEHYHPHTARWLHWCLQAGCYILVFYVTQLTIYTALGTAILLGAMRFI